MTDIADNAAANRFELHDDGHTAELVYHVDGDRLVLDHTAVPEALGGRGVGGRLVSAAIERAQRDRLILVPHCSFARSWLERHPDATAGVTVDWDA